MVGRERGRGRGQLFLGGLLKDTSGNLITSICVPIVDVAETIFTDPAWLYGLQVHADGSNFDANSTIIVLSQQIYNNSNSNSSLMATFLSSKPTEQTASWSTASGIDSYLTSPVNAALPIPAANSTATDPSA